jgi:hypothetical protein
VRLVDELRAALAAAEAGDELEALRLARALVDHFDRHEAEDEMLMQTVCGLVSVDRAVDRFQKHQDAEPPPWRRFAA